MEQQQSVDALRLIIPRDLHFGISTRPERYWYAGDPVKTAIMDSFSLFLPTGERFFIKSLKHYLPELRDAALCDEVRALCAQEALHSREHEDYNAGLRQLGYPVDAMEDRARSALGMVRGALYRLAITCAVEHVTATFSTLVLKDPEVLQGASDAYRRLWTWHALEELEHKSVALKVFYAVTTHLSARQRYLLRVGALNAVALVFTRILTQNLRAYLRADFGKMRFRDALHYLNALFGTPGFYRRSLGYFFAYFKPGFHPDQRDDGSLVAYWRSHVDDAVRNGIYQPTNVAKRPS